MNPNPKLSIEELRSEMKSALSDIKEHQQRLDTLRPMVTRTEALLTQAKIRYESLDADLALLDGRFQVVEPKLPGHKKPRSKVDPIELFKRMSTKEKAEFIRGLQKGI